MYTNKPASEMDLIGVYVSNVHIYMYWFLCESCAYMHVYTHIYMYTNKPVSKMDTIYECGIIHIRSIHD